MADLSNLHELMLAGALFVVAHLGISSTPLRNVLVGAVGERGYLAMFSLVAVVTLVYLILTFNGVAHSDFLWVPDQWNRWTAMLVMPVAMIFLIGGFMTKNPTAVGQENQLTTIGEGSGLVRITRHPFQWAVVLWAAVHIFANGDAASLIFFGSLGTVSLAGGFLMDRKKARAMGVDWTQFARVTSNVPFVAILRGRNRLVMRELWLPIVIGLAAYELLLWGHALVSGVTIM